MKMNINFMRALNPKWLPLTKASTSNTQMLEWTKHVSFAVDNYFLYPQSHIAAGAACALTWCVLIDINQWFLSLFKARQDSMRADLQQKIQLREQKMTEVRSSVTASTVSRSKILSVWFWFWWMLSLKSSLSITRFRTAWMLNGRRSTMCSQRWWESWRTLGRKPFDLWRRGGSCVAQITHEFPGEVTGETMEGFTSCARTTKYHNKWPTGGPFRPLEGLA